MSRWADCVPREQGVAPQLELFTLLAGEQVRLEEGDRRGTMCSDRRDSECDLREMVWLPRLDAADRTEAERDVKRLEQVAVPVRNRDLEDEAQSWRPVDERWLPRRDDERALSCDEATEREGKTTESGPDPT